MKNQQFQRYFFSLEVVIVQRIRREEDYLDLCFVTKALIHDFIFIDNTQPKENKQFCEVLVQRTRTTYRC